MSRSILGFVLVMLTAGLTPLTWAGDPDDPPTEPKVVDDSSGRQGLIVTVSGNGGTADDELDRAGEIFNDTLNTGVPITVYTNEANVELVRERFRDSPRVEIVVLTDDVGVEVFGSGFVRDSLPVTITVKDGETTRTKYIIDTPRMGAALIESLITKGQIKESDVIRVPFKFDGGDITTGGGFVYVTDDFYARNQPMTEAEVNQKLAKYLGVDPSKIVKLMKPPTESTGHSDLIVRPLPGGKVVVSGAGPGASKEDQAAAAANEAAVKNAVGEENVVVIANEGSSASSSYANAFVADKRVFIPTIDGGSADQAAKTAYEGALPAGYTVKTAAAGDCVQVGGGPHCRTGNLPLRVKPRRSAGRNRSPSISFDAPSGALTMTTEPISVLAGNCPGEQDDTAPEWVTDPLLDGTVFLRLTGAVLDPVRFGIDPGVVHFLGSTVEFVANANVVAQAVVPDLTFVDPIDDGFLNIRGVADAVTFTNTIASAFLDDIAMEILTGPEMYGFYMHSPIDLFELSSGFTLSFSQETDGAGLAFFARADSCGACCVPEAPCADDLIKPQCAELGGEFMGAGSDCVEDELCPFPTPVDFAYLRSEWRGDVAVVRWEVTRLSDHSGFHVHRESPGRGRVRLTETLLRGERVYEFVDRGAPAGGAHYWLEEASTTGDVEWFGPIRLQASPRTPTGPRLSGVRPNPFGTRTRIAFSLPEEAVVTLEILDVQGRHVATLTQGPERAGDYEVEWDGRDVAGAAMAPGIYFVRLIVGGVANVQKIVMAR